MEQEIKLKIDELYNSLDGASWKISNAIRSFDNLEMALREKNKKQIKDIDNFKRELERDGLYTDKIEEFLESYMRYYNK